MVFRILGNLTLGSFLCVAALGYVYFGPPEYTRIVSNTALFRESITPFFDKLLSLTTEESVTIAHLGESQGELSFRPASEMVFLPARQGQRFYGGTILSTGEGSRAVFSLVDSSEVVIEENSTLLLDLLKARDGEAPTLNLKVLQGNVTAEKKSDDSKLTIKLVTPKGKIQKVSKKKVIVVATKSQIDPRLLLSFKALVAREKRQNAEFSGVAPTSLTSKDIEQQVTSGKLVLAPELPGNVAEVEEVVQKSAPTVVEKPLLKAEAEELTPEPEPELEPEHALVLTPEEPKLVEQKPEEPKVIEKKIVTTEEVVKSKKVVAKRKPASIKPAAKPVIKIAEIKKPEVAPEKPKPVVKEWKPPEGSDVANSVAASKEGKTEESQRLLARALTREEYQAGGFNDAVRLAVDGIMQGYAKNKECGQAKNVLSNVKRSYSTDRRAKRWTSKWEQKIGPTCRDVDLWVHFR